MFSADNDTQKTQISASLSATVAPLQGGMYSQDRVNALLFGQTDVDALQHHVEGMSVTAINDTTGGSGENPEEPAAHAHPKEMSRYSTFLLFPNTGEHITAHNPIPASRTITLTISHARSLTILLRRKRCCVTSY